MKFGIRDWLFYVTTWIGVIMYGFVSYKVFDLQGMMLPAIYGAVLTVLGFIAWSDRRSTR